MIEVQIWRPMPPEQRLKGNVMKREGISQFQIKQYQVLNFSLINTIVPPYEIQNVKIEHSFAREHEMKYDPAEKHWLGSLYIQYNANLPTQVEEQKFCAEIGIVGLFEYDADDTDKQKDIFENLIRLNGTVSLLAIMRGIVAASTSALGFRPGLIMPSINLNKFEWDKVKRE